MRMQQVSASMLSIAHSEAYWWWAVSRLEKSRRDISQASSKGQQRQLHRESCANHTFPAHSFASHASKKTSAGACCRSNPPGASGIPQLVTSAATSMPPCTSE